MAIRLKAEDADWGMVLCEIPSLADARQLRQFLFGKGLEPIITADAATGCTILLYGLDRETFDRAIVGADVEVAD